MGFLDALTADAYPRDSQGRRVFAPYGRRGRAYVLPDEPAKRLRRFHRRSFQIYFLSLVGAALTLGPWAVLAVGILWIAVFLGGIHILSRGLEVAHERPVISREERVRRSMRAMGRPTMAAICLVGAASAAMGGSLLLRGERHVAVWFITVYGGTIAVLYGRQWGKADAVPPAT